MKKDYHKVKYEDNLRDGQHLNEFNSQIGSISNNKTVFSELKLSEVLLHDVDAYKNIINLKSEKEQ